MSLEITDLREGSAAVLTAEVFHSCNKNLSLVNKLNPDEAKIFVRCKKTERSGTRVCQHVTLVDSHFDLFEADLASLGFTFMPHLEMVFHHVFLRKCLRATFPSALKGKRS